MSHAAWTRLEAAAQVAGTRRIDSLFAAEPDRVAALSVEAAGIYLDLSKQTYTWGTR